MSSITIRGGWYSTTTLDVSKSDKFACEAIAQFFSNWTVQDLGDYLRIDLISPKQAREFIAYCE